MQAENCSGPIRHLTLPNLKELLPAPSTYTSDTMRQSSYPCNTFVFDGNVPQGTRPHLVAGFMQLGRTTAEEFYYYLEFCIAQPPPREYRLLSADGIILLRHGNLEPTSPIDPR